MEQEKQLKWLASKDVAKLLGVKPITVSVWARQGIIPCYKFNSKYSFLESEIMEWIEQKRKGVEANG